MGNIFKVLLFCGLALFLPNGEARSKICTKPKEEKQEQPELPYGLLAPDKCCEKRAPFFSSVSYLHWQTKMGGLEYAAKNTGGMFPTSISIKLDTRIFTPDFAWGSGVKVEFGYLLPYDGWDVKTRWTYIKSELTDIKRNMSSAPFTEGSLFPSGEGVMPLWFFPHFASSFFPLEFQNANDSWHLHFNAFDIEWGKFFKVNNWLSLRLHGGLKGAIFRQNFGVNYQGGNSIFVTMGSDIVLISYLSSQLRSKNNLWGIGPRVGVDSRWKIGGGLSLIADSSFTLLPSFFRVKARIDDLIFNPEDAPTVTSFFAKWKEKFTEFIPVFQTMLGLEWGMCVSQKSPLYLLITAGYEMQYWWDINQTRRVITSTLPGFLYNNKGDWQSQGLTASLSFQY